MKPRNVRLLPHPCGGILGMSLMLMLTNVHIVNADWRFEGTLVLPPVCQLNQDNPIQVPFGKVGVRKLDGEAFKQDIPYQIKCEGDEGQPWNVTLMFSGTLAGAGFDNSTLVTAAGADNEGKLGIQIQKNGIPLELNQPFLINASEPPALSATPVKRPGVELVGGDFTATGTLTIDFQ